MLKRLKFRFKVNKLIRKVLRKPPKGQEIKNYTFKGLTNDIFFVANIKLVKYDIGLLTSNKENTFDAYLISEFEAAKKRVEEQKKQLAFDKEYERVNSKYFKEFLESRDEFMSDRSIKDIIQGYTGFESRGMNLYREYMGTDFGRKAHEEIVEYEKNNP